MKSFGQDRYQPVEEPEPVAQMLAMPACQIPVTLVIDPQSLHLLGVQIAAAVAQAVRNGIRGGLETGAGLDGEDLQCRGAGLATPDPAQLADLHNP